VQVGSYINKNDSDENCCNMMVAYISKVSYLGTGVHFICCLHINM
jgi:hypothetical protein